MIDGSWMRNKKYYKFCLFVVCLVSAMFTVCPGFLVFVVPEKFHWLVFVLIPFSVAQFFFIGGPIATVLEKYHKANSKRGLLHEEDVYKLFEENGTAKLHVSDIDKLPRYNVDIPDTEYQLFTDTIPVIEDSSGTERNIERSYVRCLHCDYTFPSTVIDDEDFKHCPCCGNRIARYRVPKDWYEKRQGTSCENTTRTTESIASMMRRK